MSEDVEEPKKKKEEQRKELETAETMQTKTLESAVL